MGRCWCTHCHARCTRGRNFASFPPLLLASCFVARRFSSSSSTNASRPRVTSPPLSAFLCGLAVLSRFTFLVFFFVLALCHEVTSLLPAGVYLVLCPSSVPFTVFFLYLAARPFPCNAPLLLGPRRNYRVLRFASGLPRWCWTYRWSTPHRDPRNGFFCFILPLCRFLCFHRSRPGDASLCIGVFGNFIILRSARSGDTSFRT